MGVDGSLGCECSCYTLGMEKRTRLTLSLRRARPMKYEVVPCPECKQSVAVYQAEVSAPEAYAGRQGGEQLDAVYIGECPCGATVVMAEE